MEYLPGADLSSLISLAQERGIDVPLEVAVAILIQLCEALEYLHNVRIPRGGCASTASIIHGDISPKNLFIQPDGQVKLIDFGIAPTIQRRTQGDTVVHGTYRYMSPERLGHLPTGIGADIFAAGIVLYDLLYMSGDGNSTIETICDSPCRILAARSRAPGPARWLPNVSCVLARALARSPKERYHSAASMKADLRLLKCAADQGRAAVSHFFSTLA